MFTFRSITPFYTFNRPSREVTRKDGNETIITKVPGPPITFEKYSFTTADEATADFIRKNPLFGKEIFEVIVEPKPVAENGTPIIEASTKNEMIDYLVTEKKVEVSTFAGMSKADVEAFGLTLGVTFAKTEEAPTGEAEGLTLGVDLGSGSDTTEELVIDPSEVKPAQGPVKVAAKTKAEMIAALEASGVADDLTEMKKNDLIQLASERNIEFE